jgi:rod shape-determining protein MreC
MPRFLLILWRNFKEYIILLLLVSISLYTLSINQTPAAKKVKTIAFGSFAVITSVVSNAINITKIKNENDRLRKVNAELMLHVNELREYGIQNIELKKLLGLKDSLKYPLIPSEVISKSFSNVQGSITLNAGSKNGVKPGMPVINDQGIVGIVYNTSDDYSIARILKNFDLKLTVKDERSRINGILKWNGENLVIVNVPRTYDVEIGDRLITSDLSTIVPIPLPVGIVTEINNSNTGIFNEVVVKPFVDFVRVENVFVLGIVQSDEKNNMELNFFKRENSN